jgi:ATP-dependent Zn protease
MEPQLISRKAIKKLLKKKYFDKTNHIDNTLNSVISKVKINWLPILIIVFAILILIHLYINNKNNKKNKEIQDLELFKINKKKEYFEDDDFKTKPNYESEYYKMIPRVMNNPEVIPYKY